MDVQISHCVHTEVWEEDCLQQIQGEHCADTERSMPMEGSRDHRGESALMIFDRHANLKYKYGKRHFWARGYYVSTVGLNEATIAKYVREQEKHDQMMDRISTKEAEDPFRGS
jgi:putative transposase